MTDQTTAVRSTATLNTEHASKYLQQLCKHFAHKRPVTFDPHKGQIAFDSGDCHLTADGNMLTMTCTSPDTEKLTHLEGVVDRHLVRFAFREELKLDWKKV